MAMIAASGGHPYAGGFGDPKSPPSPPEPEEGYQTIHDLERINAARAKRERREARKSQQQKFSDLKLPSVAEHYCPRCFSTTHPEWACPLNSM